MLKCRCELMDVAWNMNTIGSDEREGIGLTVQRMLLSMIYPAMFYCVSCNINLIHIRCTQGMLTVARMTGYGLTVKCTERDSSCTRTATSASVILKWCVYDNSLHSIPLILTNRCYLPIASGMSYMLLFENSSKLSVSLKHVGCGSAHMSWHFEVLSIYFIMFMSQIWGRFPERYEGGTRCPTIH